MKHPFVLSLLLAGILSAQTTSTKPAPASPKPQRQTAATRAALNVGPSYEDLKFPPLREVKIPEVGTFTLPNGIKLYLLEDHELPLVSGFALVRTGNLFDPADKVGLAQLTGMVMRTGGTKSKTGEQLDIELENIAASVETSIGETSGRVSFNTLREHTDDVLAAFKELLISPAFRQDKLDLAKNQMRSVIARRNDEASAIAGREFQELVYGHDNPYGWSMEYHHLDNIQREDLAAFYERYFFPANILLAVQGDFKTEEMKAKLEKLFADWNVKREPVPPFPDVSSETRPGIYLATKDDVTQTFFQFGHLGGILKDPDYPALSVMADILGGGFSSRLFRVVRTQKGLAYGVSSGWGADYNHPGLFRVGGSTKSESTVDTIQATLSEIEKIRTSEVTDQELETAKQSVLNSFVFFFDTPGKVLSRVVTYEYHGYPKDFIFEYQKAVEKVTKADILRVAKQHINPEIFTTVAVGKPQEFSKPLTVLGEVEKIDLTIPEPGKPAAKTDAASIEKGNELLQKAQQALGGADKLAAIKDYTLVSTVDIQTPQGAIKATQRSQIITPNQIRQEQELPFGKIIAYWDGKSGWLSTPQGIVPMPPPVAKQVQGELFRGISSIMLSDRESERTVSATGDNAVEITSKTGDSVRIEFDASGLPAKQIYQAVSMDGAPAKSEAALSDWREVAGVKLPHKILIERNGQKYADVTVQEWQINTGLTSEELVKKP